MPEQGTSRRRGDRLGPRASEIVAAARRTVEQEGAEALTMRRLANAVGVRAPSLYKHFADKAAVEAALIDEGFEEIAVALEQALAEHGESLAAIAGAFRGFARDHPSLYRLMTSGPLPRHRLRPGVEARAAAPLLRIIADADLARAAWAWAHGMTILELDGRFPLDADLDGAWERGIAAFEAMAIQGAPSAISATVSTP